jgi:hypothetical protein
LMGNTDSQRGSILGRETTIGVDHLILLEINREDITKRQIHIMIQNVQKWIEIPGVQSVTVGSIFVKRAWMEDRTHGYTHYIRVRFDGVRAMKKCNSHPTYIECIQKIVRPLLSQPPLIVNCDADMILAKKIDDPSANTTTTTTSTHNNSNCTTVTFPEHNHVPTSVRNITTAMRTSTFMKQDHHHTPSSSSSSSSSSDAVVDPPP